MTIGIPQFYRRLLTRRPYLVAAELHWLWPVCAALMLAASAAPLLFGWRLAADEAFAVEMAAMLALTAAWAGKQVLRPRFPFREMVGERRARGRVITLAGGFAAIAAVGTAAYVALRAPEEWFWAACLWWFGLPLYMIFGRTLYTLTTARNARLLAGLAFAILPIFVFALLFVFNLLLLAVPFILFFAALLWPFSFSARTIWEKEGSPVTRLLSFHYWHTLIMGYALLHVVAALLAGLVSVVTAGVLHNQDLFSFEETAIVIFTSLFPPLTAKAIAQIDFSPTMLLAAAPEA